MKSVNRIEIKGIVGQDARINKAGNRNVANFSVATEYAWTDRDGNKMAETEWHNIAAWEGYGIADLSRITKGARVSIVGRLRTRKYNDNQGNQRYITEVIAEELDIIDDLPKVNKQPTGNATQSYAKKNNNDIDEF